MVALCLTHCCRGQEGYRCKPAGWLSVCIIFLAQMRDTHVWLISNSKLVVDVSVGLAPFILQLLSGGIGSSHSIK